MSSSSVLGALRVIIGGDNSGLDKSLKDSQTNVSSFANAAQIGLAAVATAAVAAGAALGVMISKAIDNADNLNKMSQSTGLSVESLSKLSYAAELADVSQESLGKSMGKLSKAMVSAATDGAGSAGQAFTAMGVSVKNTDGTLRSSSDVLGDVADKFSGYRDGASKTSLAIAIFGKAGAAMIPLLNQGKDGLQEAGDEAQKFGLVLDKKTTMAAEAFNDNLKKMDKIKQGLVTTIAAQLLPTFEHFSEVMLEARQNSTLMSTAAEWLVAGFKFMVSEVAQTIVHFQRLGVEATALWKLLNAPWGEIGKAWDEFRAEGRKSEEVFTSLKTTIDAAFKPPAEAVDWTSQLIGVKSMQKEIAQIAGEWAKTEAPAAAAGEAAKNAVQKFLEAQAKRTAGMLAEAQAVGLSTAALEKLKIVKEGEAIADNNKIAKTPELIASITAAADAASGAAMKLQAAQISQQVMSPAEKYAQDLANLQTVYQSTDMTMETFQARQQQLAEGTGATWQQAAAQGASGFAQLATQFGKSSQEMAIAAKAFGIVEATINTYTAFTKALAGSPPPFNYVMAAGVLAAGMAKVAAIKSQSVGGFMTGGSMMVRGSGGPDSVPVSMDLSPGEQVDIWRPNEGGGSDPRRGGASGSTQALNINFQGLIGREGVRSLLDEINEALGDGHRLKLV